MREFIQAVHDASAMHGELRRIFLAAAAVMLLAFIAWGIQEWGVRKTSVAIGWLGISCLAAGILGSAAILFTLSLI